MIFIPVVLVAVGVGLFILGLVKDSVGLYVAAALAAGAAGIASAIVSALAKARQARTPPPPVMTAQPVPGTFVYQQPAPMYTATAAPPPGAMLLPAGAPPPPGYIAYVPVGAQPAAPAPAAAPPTAQPPSPGLPTSVGDERFAPPTSYPDGYNPIFGYDTMTPAEITERLGSNGMGPPELSAVRRYELQHAARVDVLVSIDHEMARRNQGG